ncbi:MAG: pilus assembly protein PilM [Candidatus Omnitrophota bacterium]
MAGITVVEIDSEIVKILHAQNNSKDLHVEKILAYPVKGLSAEDISLTIVKLIKANGIKIDKLVGLMSRSDVTIRVLKLPSADANELEKMASFEAVKQIPFPAEEIFFDYRRTYTDQQGYSEVIIAIAHRNAVNKLVGILNKAGLKPDILTLTTEGLYLWSKTALSETPQTTGAVLIMDIDRNNVETEIISDTRILLSRISSFGASALSESALEHSKYRERLLLETKRSIDIYNKEQKKNLPVEKIIITGPLKDAHLIADMINDRLGIPASVVENIKTFSVADNAFSQEGLPEGTSISSSLGALFGLAAQSLNILPPEVKKKWEIAQKWNKAVVLGILGICIFLMITATAAIKFYQKRAFLANLKSSTEKISPITEDLEGKSKKLQMAQSHIDAANAPLTFLYELHRVIPAEILLNYLNYNDKGKIILQGTTPAMSDVFKFVNKLEQSAKLKNVETRYVSKRRIREQETVDFQITCEFSKDNI